MIKLTKNLSLALVLAWGANAAFAEPLTVADGTYVHGSTKFSNGRHIAEDSLGRLHTVFTQITDNAAGSPGRYAYSDDHGATWTTGLSDLDQGRAIDPAWGNFTPAIRVGSDNSIHIVWYQAYLQSTSKAIFYIVSKDRGRTFSQPQAITTRMAASSYVWPAIALDSANNPHVVFSDPFGTKGIFYTHLTGDGWANPISISGTSTPKDTAGIEFNPALGPQGALFAFWDDASADGKANVNRTDNLGSSWEGVSVALSTPGSRVLWPSMTFDSRGNSYMSVTLNKGSVFKVWILKRDVDGNWSKPSLDNLFPGDQVKGYMRSQITMDANDRVYIFLEGTPTSRKNWNIFSTDADTANLEVWGAPRRISDSATGDNAFVSVPTRVNSSTIPVIWTHGDISDAETGHLSSELPANGRTSVMFSDF